MMKHLPANKPALSEIFAAMTGLRCAGFTLASEGVSSAHPVVDTAGRAVMLGYDLKTALLHDPQSALPVKNTNPGYRLTPSPEGQERAARKCLTFLAAARETLKDYSALELTDSKKGRGGTLADVFGHIDQLMATERHGKIRPASKITVEGQIAPVYGAGYLPGFTAPSQTGKAAAPLRVPEAAL